MKLLILSWWRHRLVTNNKCYSESYSYLLVMALKAIGVGCEWRVTRRGWVLGGRDQGQGGGLARAGDGRGWHPGSQQAIPGIGGNSLHAVAFFPFSTYAFLFISLIYCYFQSSRKYLPSLKTNPVYPFLISLTHKFFSFIFMAQMWFYSCNAMQSRFPTPCMTQHTKHGGREANIILHTQPEQSNSSKQLYLSMLIHQCSRSTEIESLQYVSNICLIIMFQMKHDSNVYFYNTS